MKFKELFKTIRYSVHNIELYDSNPVASMIFWAGNPVDLLLSMYLNIEDSEVLEIKVRPENNDCVMLIRLKVTRGERG